MKFKRLNTANDVSELIKFHNSNSESIVIDVETTSVNPRECTLLDIQLSGSNEDSAVIFSQEFRELLKDISKSITLVGHNYKFDAHVLYRHGVDLLDRKWRDTLLLGHLLDENRDSYSLDSYVKEYWNENYKEEFWSKYKSYKEAPEEEKVDYACRDVVYTGRLFREFRERAQHSLEQIPDSLVEHVHCLQTQLLRTEIQGIRIDLKYLEELGVKLKQRIGELEPKMRSLVKDELDVLELDLWEKDLQRFKTDKRKAGVPKPTFNFESSKQLADLVYRRLGLPVQKNPKTRQISTDYESLQKIKDYHPVISLIQENRELQKVYGSYIEGTLDRSSNGRIYPEFRVAGTVTGRLAHSNPNLAQLPKSGGIRGIYVPDPGRVFVSADYDQLEVVLEANLTGDRSLRHMLENGESKHDYTARELGCTRDTAKTLNFALQYWCTASKVAKLLGVSKDEGTRIWNKYWEVYSGPKRLKAKTDKMVDSGEVLSTVFGRKRRFEVRERNEWDGDYRQAYNFLIQSTGADITSKAFYLIAEELLRSGQGRGLFTVHDEIILEVDERVCHYWDKRLIDVMCVVGNECNLTIPLKAKSSGAMLRWEDK